MFVSWISEGNYYSWGKNFFTLSHNFRAYGMGNKTRFPFPRGTGPGFRADFYLLPIFDMERIGERTKLITVETCITLVSHGNFSSFLPDFR